MANQVEIEDHYDTIGTLHALRLKSEHDGYPDYTCAFFDGDYSKSLKQAQEDKHAWIFEGLGLGQDLTGKRILDIGCGWGPILNAVRKRGGTAVGLTLSSGQVKYNEAHGLDCRLLDYKKINIEELGKFDAVISIGAFEHFCSVDECKNGLRENIYRDFFKICSDLLVPNGKLFLQTMTWGKKDINIDTINHRAEKDSDDAVISRLMKFYPGSWLPAGLEQIKQCASPYFNFIKTNNGRLDYIETLKRWHHSSKNLLKPSLIWNTIKASVPVLLRSLYDSGTRTLLYALYRGDQTSAFKREIMSHERMFYSKK